MKNFRFSGARAARRVRRPRAYLAFAVPLALPLVLATVASAPTPDTSYVAAAMIAPPRLAYAELEKRPSAQLPVHSVVLPMENGDTLASVLMAAGISRSDANVLTSRFGESVDLRRLRPGNLVRFHHDAGGIVDSVELKVNGWGEIDAVRGADGFEVRPHQAEQREIESTVSATIESSLYEALRNAGEGPLLAQQLVDVFQWDIDFFALQKGDAFTLVVRKKFAGSDLIGYGPITAARFIHDGDTYEAFLAEDGGGYYGRGGTPLRKQFLRAPLQFTRITSSFSKSRYHPLLHYFRPHHGVDYGAPVGTPVMSTADGVVDEATYNRGEGNFVRIRHTSRIETSYLHLSRFAKNVHRGAKVRQGEVIGYVGATGLATGPHLDYRVNDGGTWLDPLKLKSITPDPLRGAQLARFRAEVSRLTPRLSVAAAQMAQTTTRRRALF